MVSSYTEDWIKQFDPRKRVLTGKAYMFSKRILDLFLVIFSLPLWLPIVGIIATIIWISSPGAPVIFTQLRTGKGGRRFSIYKFRTMVPNAEELKVKYAHLNELQWPDFKITNDPRITQIGRFLRKTSLDELPQFFNVLVGNMSLVGPRPPIPYEIDSYKNWHLKRICEVKPGITGMWQAYGRSETTFDDMVRYDIQYVDNQSFLLDIRILFATIFAVFKSRGAM